MSLDLHVFAEKLRRYRELFAESIEHLASATGISSQTIADLEGAARTPTGDEVLILADHFRCDFKYFISNERAAPIERSEKLFRALSSELTAQDRRAIQEFLYLCECEAQLLRLLSKPPPLHFNAVVQGNYFKGHGERAARDLRAALGHAPRTVPDVFADLRALGIHVFRRRLQNGSISGLFIDHSDAGPCVLVNYDEDVYRQRFTAAHEGAHAIFDRADEFVVSFDRDRSSGSAVAFNKWSRDDLREKRANSFAGAFLVPADLVGDLGSAPWTESRVTALAKQLRVNAQVVLIALQREGRISKAQSASLGAAKVSRASKDDPELPLSLTDKSRARRTALLERGLSSYYVELGFEAFQRDLISAARLAEMFLVTEADLRDLAETFSVRGV